MTKYVLIVLFVVTILPAGCANDSRDEPGNIFEPLVYEPPEYIYQAEVVSFPRLPGLPNIGAVANFLQQPGFSKLQVISIESKDWGDDIMLPSDVSNVFPGNDEFLVFFNQDINLHGINAETEETEFVLNWLDSGVMASRISMNDYVDRKKGTVHFDRDSFVQLLEFANTFPAESINSLEPILSGCQIMLSGAYGDINWFRHDRTLLGPETIFKGFPVESKGGHLLIPHESVAITTGCRDAEGAWLFIRSMLLDDFQRNLDNFQRSYLTLTSPTLTFPANRLVFDEKIDEEMNSYIYSYIGKIVGYDEWLRIPISLLSREEADMIEELLYSLTIISEDKILWNIISESASDFFGGRITAAEAARVIQSRASRYMSELG